MKGPALPEVDAGQAGASGYLGEVGGRGPAVVDLAVPGLRQRCFEADEIPGVVPGGCPQRL